MTNQGPTRPLMLVTGSSGLIGALLVREFSRDFTVVGIDTKPPGDQKPGWSTSGSLILRRPLRRTT